jgi:peptidoglycan/LPS O-acetylase OafA/YrhL
LNQQPIKTYTYLPAIDCLRFFVFLMILANHTNVNRFVNGHSFFFTLTGFLISYISISEIKKNNSFRFGRYLARRFLRTLPLYFLIVLLSFTTAFFSYIFFDKTLTTGKLWHFLLLIHNFFGQNILFPLANLWAMGVTEQYYLLLGILFLIFNRRYHWFGFAFLILGLLINCISFFYFHFYNYNYSWNFLINFGIGNLLALFCINRGALFEKLYSLNFLNTIIFCTTGVLLVLFGFANTSEVFIPFKELVLSIGYCFLIFNLGFGKHRPYFLDRATLLQELGKRTLGFYCWHAPVVTLIEKGLEYFFNLHLSSYALFFTAFAATWPLVYLSYRFYEKKFILLKDKFY